MDTELTNTSPKALSRLVSGIEKHVRPDPEEWDHEAFLRYRQRMGEWANAGLCKAIGIPTAEPPEPERPAFLPDPNRGDDPRAELERLLNRHATDN